MESPQTQYLIYVVDDESIIAESMGAVLQAHGYEVEVFTSPLDALGRIRVAAQKPCLLLTDYVMPGMNGVQLAKELRSLIPNLRVVICSGNVGVETFNDTDYPPDAFIAKPYTIAGFMSVVKGVLCRSVQ